MRLFRYADAGGQPIRILALVLAPLLVIPFAAAGTPDAPEVTDAADDCAFLPGNHYGDITAAWISDETEADFVVNIQLSKWTADPLGTAAGYTLQFTHQGIQFGAVALFGGGVLAGWDYGNAFVDLTTGELSNYTAAEGSFTPGTPALLSITFAKSMFPHADAADNKLVAFQGGTADFKAPLPVWFAEGLSGQDVPVEPPFFACDTVESSATYTFQTGGHSMHGGPAPGVETNATREVEPTPAATSMDETADAPAADDASNDAPGPGVALVLAAAGAALLATRRRA